MAAIGPGWEDGAWVEASWIAAAWGAVVAAVGGFFRPIFRPRRREEG